MNRDEVLIKCSEILGSGPPTNLSLCFYSSSYSVPSLQLPIFLWLLLFCLDTDTLFYSSDDRARVPTPSYFDT